MVRVHTPLGLNSSPRASPATLGSQDVDGPGPHQWVQAMYGELFMLGPFLGPLVTLGPQQIWAQGSILVLGASINPHGPQTMAYGPWPTDRKTTAYGPRPTDPKASQKANYGQIHQNTKKGQKAIKNQHISRFTKVKATAQNSLEGC
ncbi:hypothetical protein O181_131776 [Austropuccinia psidii MF-1]|uniref:Uncharacterized protein n=1 Tax=Austropuccinia psidii MF-1 TaxID=1389203 RepID=A0A9Q3L5B4_9BASI|nr:hypothetical protein [Austropuccinia psidii MF-1]